MPSEDRIEDLLGRMTLAEKIGQMTMLSAPDVTTGPGAVAELDGQVRTGQVGSVLNLVGRERIRRLQGIATAESRLGIPLLFGLDVVHGYRTILPVPLGEAAAFEPELWRRTARLAAREAAADGIDLTFAPMIDVCRDPRWGRVVEGPGEDPWLAARFARAKVEGFQGGQHAILPPEAIGATAKHIGGYGAVTAGLDYGPADVSPRLMEEVYLPSFRAAVEAGVQAVMPSFIDLSGMPATANEALLKGVLRGRWGFDGVIVSDYGSVAELIQHGVAADLVEAAALALRAGIDIDMMGGAYQAGLPAALERGTARLEDVDAAVRRVLRLKQRLGLLQDPEYRSTGRGGPVAPLAGEARDLAGEAARRSMVLLRNEGDTLPLKRDGGRIVLLGPMAHAAPEPIGPWTAQGGAHERPSLLDAMRHALAGRAVDRAPADVEEALLQAADASVVVLCLGETYELSGEAASRAEPVLPKGQAELARRVLALGRPTILVLWSGRPLVATDILQRADAVLAAWLPCAGWAAAVAAILSGQEDATGRLPISWPANVGQIPVFFGHRPTGRPYAGGAPFTIRYLDAPLDPLFPFGHGLSYARFEIGPPVATPPMARIGADVEVETLVRNVGERAGEETVFLFIRDSVASISRPVLELRGVEHVRLAPGEGRMVRFSLSAADFAFPGPEMDPLVEPGDVDLFVGPCADPARLLGTTLRLVSGGAAGPS